MANFFPFIIYVLVTTFTPGPNNIMAMTNGIRYGYKRTLGFLGGMAAGFLVILLICGLLNIALMNLLPQMRFWINILGVVYMLYLAVHTLLSKPVEDSGGKDGFNTFAAGFALQFLNPKLILYGVTIFSIFITPAFQNPWVVSLFAPLLAAVGFVAVSAWALGGSIFRTFYRGHFRIFNTAMAALLVYTAAASYLQH